jgi:hypothetical protein
MVKYFCSFCFVAVLLTGCGLNHSDSANNPAIASQPDSSCYPSTIRNFLHWYRQNHEKIDSIALIKDRAAGESSRYVIDFDGVKKYLSVLRSSGYFTDAFLLDKEAYFQICEKNLAVSKQNDGPPEGLDFDLLLLTQEPDLFWQRPDTLSIRGLPGDHMTGRVLRVSSFSNHLLFDMRSAPGGCRINNIRFDDSDKGGEEGSNGLRDEIMGTWAAAGEENATFVLEKNTIIYPDHNASYKYLLEKDSLKIKFDGYDGNYLIRKRGKDTLIMVGKEEQVFFRFRK